MTEITAATAKAQLDKWVVADAELAEYQSYTIVSRTMTMADADMVTRKIKYWQNVLSAARRQEDGGEGVSIRSARFNHGNR